MASPSIPPIHADESKPSAEEPRLTRDEGWALIVSLFGSAKEAYAEVGGAEAWIAAERAAWGD